MAKMKLDDVLNDTKEEVQTFKKAEKKAKILEKVASEKKEIGRPPKDESQKAKKRVLYYTDEEWNNIERVSELYGMKPSKWLKMVIAKELRRESINTIGKK
jgi:FMN phosphatase YigB (HAD superfamily)